MQPSHDLTVSDVSDVWAREMVDNETWVECLDCHDVTRDQIPIPGLLYRYTICAPCRRIRILAGWKHRRC